MDDITDVIGVLTGFATVVLSLGIAFWWIYWSFRKRQLQFDERRLMIEKGLTPPPMLPEESKKVTPQESLRRGFVLLFLGAGLAVGGIIAGGVVEEELGGLIGVAAAIVAFIGMGNLAYYFIARNRKQDPQPDTLA